MNKLITAALAAAAVTLTAQVANAACYDYGNTVVCDDGNTYNTIGNTTFGSNSRTGSTWSQTTIGNYNFGTDSDGNSWSSYNNGYGSNGDKNLYGRGNRIWD